MNNNIFLLPFLVSFSIAVLLLAVIVGFLKTKNSNKRISLRHIHKPGVSRFGGVSIILSFITALLLDEKLVISNQLIGIIIVSLAILIVGIFDDLKQISWEKQLIFQIIVASFVFAIGIRLEYITNPFGGILLFNQSFGYIINFLIVTFWLLLIINAMNWVDGIDGVSGGISMIGVLTIFLVSLRPEVNQPPVAIISAALIGSILAFVIFNFNPAKIMAGTSGSVFMGFILAILALFAGAKIATTLLVLAVPVVDALWVIGERFRQHRSPFKADRRHLHYRLLELGWSQKKICIFYWSITTLIAILALSSSAMEKVILFGFIIFVMFFIYGQVSKKLILAN